MWTGGPNKQVYFLHLSQSFSILSWKEYDSLDVLIISAVANLHLYIVDIASTTVLIMATRKQRLHLRCCMRALTDKLSPNDYNYPESQAPISWSWNQNSDRTTCLKWSPGQIGIKLCLISLSTVQFVGGRGFGFWFCLSQGLLLG